jgi:H+/gluconate symporter-like permease
VPDASPEPVKPAIDTIEPDATPTTIETARPAPVNTACWALLNLILTVATGAVMAFVVVAYFIKRKKKEDEYIDEYLNRYLNGDTNGDTSRDTNGDTSGRLPLRLITVAATAVSIILFIITEDMRAPMVIADRWTLMHAVITVITLIVSILSGRKHEEDRETMISIQADRQTG